MNISDNNVERSLLQKAVRRGNVDLTEKVVNYLVNKGDMSWLKKRLFVIAYEECWTFGTELILDRNPDTVIKLYKKLAAAVKKKDAAGLAGLAMAVHDGRMKLSTTDYYYDLISSVTNAIRYKEKFWSWIMQQPGYAKNQTRIDMAHEAITKAAFDYDKALMLAAAYLSVKDMASDTKPAQPNNDPDFPYWIAFDRHTYTGRDVIEEAAKTINILPSRGEWLTFYFEGSVCSQATSAPLWREFVELELRRIGFNSVNNAQQKWDLLKPILIGKLSSKAQALKDRINTLPKIKEDDQFSLF